MTWKKFSGEVIHSSILEEVEKPFYVKLKTALNLKFVSVLILKLKQAISILLL